MSTSNNAALVSDPQEQKKIENFLTLEHELKLLESQIQEKKQQKVAAIKDLGFESENDSKFLAFVDKVTASDLYKSIAEGLKSATLAIKGASDSTVVKNIGSGVKNMALGLAKSLSIVKENPKSEEN